MDTTTRPLDLPRGLRGDYASAGADFALSADSIRFDAADHATWRLLHRRQSALLPGHAAAAFRDGLARLPFDAGVPDFARTSAALRARTGWSVIPVPGLIPDHAFFDHLAARRFPVTTWIRRPEELDYIVEPDIFHDAFGHVPLLMQPEFAGFLQAYGRLGQQAARIGALAPLARLYWFMVEFGLVEEEGALRAYGAGILSSAAETRHALQGRGVRRLRFDLMRVLRSAYAIDEIQPVYFVIRDYAELFGAMRLLPQLLAAARDAAPIPPGAAAPGDIEI
jgi:phenylalanine-4-hydroxylase